MMQATQHELISSRNIDGKSTLSNYIELAEPSDDIIPPQLDAMRPVVETRSTYRNYEEADDEAYVVDHFQTERNLRRSSEYQPTPTAKSSDDDNTEKMDDYNSEIEGYNSEADPCEINSQPSDNEHDGEEEEVDCEV